MDNVYKREDNVIYAHFGNASTGRVFIFDSMNMLSEEDERTLLQSRAIELASLHDTGNIIILNKTEEKNENNSMKKIYI